MTADLPQFRKVNRAHASRFIHAVLTGPSGSALRQLIEYEDNHFRALFSAEYFASVDGGGRPSKSQWNTLKKKIRRRDRRVFIFRRYGELPRGGGQTGEPLLYIDFGFRRE